MLIIKQPSLPPENSAFLQIRGGYKILVDKDRLEFLKQFNWFLLKSASTIYPVTRRIRNGKTYTVRMHRLLTAAPDHMKVHHINHNSLDCRLDNLAVITEREHRHFDGWHIFEQKA
jgi:hypothetical protein